MERQHYAEAMYGLHDAGLDAYVTPHDIPLLAIRRGMSRKDTPIAHDNTVDKDVIDGWLVWVKQLDERQEKRKARGAGMTDQDIKTVSALQQAMRTCREIRVQVRFGTCEKWIKIGKAEAKRIILPMKMDETPEHYEMYTGLFGHVENNVLYLG